MRQPPRLCTVTGWRNSGGIGWYARALGLAAHRITAAEVVLADGRIVHASDSEHPDLMWALRGAGTDVGIVTELEFEAFAFDTVHAGLLTWDLSEVEKVFPAWAAWAAQAPARSRPRCGSWRCRRSTRSRSRCADAAW
jgi:FAD/FMN-containing dehydrogenase